MSERFCDVALPVPLPTLFTYSVPAPLCESVQPGSRVLVPFRRKAMVGVVVKNGTQPPAGTKIRPVERALDLVPALPPALLD
ncbi:MAG: primosomal protein N', partial [Acidobacteria bacterium]